MCYNTSQKALFLPTNLTVKLSNILAAYQCLVCTAQRRQRVGSSAEAVADLPVLSANAPTHTPSNTTNAPMYASLSLVEDGGTTAPTALSLLAAMAAPVERSTAIADAPPPPMKMRK